MELLLKEAKQRGLEWEEIGHSAVFKTGCLEKASKSAWMFRAAWSPSATPFLMKIPRRCSKSK
jgi:hypothetical protein